MKNKNFLFSTIYSYAIKKVASLMKVPVKAVDKFLTITVKTFLIISVGALVLWFVSPWMFNGNRISVVAMRLIIALFSASGFLLRVKLSWREMRETPDSAEYIADIPTTRLNNIHGLVLGVNEEGEYAVSPEGEEAMALLVGPPGSGKTSAFVIPSIRFWGHNCRTYHTVFAIDIAGDIYKNTSAYRKRKKVVYIGANNALESASYDILYDKDLRFSFIDFYDEEVGVYFCDCPETIYEVDISSCENMQDAIDEIYYAIETEYRRRKNK